MENIVEYLKLGSDFLLGIVWPFSILLVIYYFRNEIKERFPHIRKISPSGVELGQQKTSDIDANHPQGSLVNLLERRKTALTEKLEKDIQDDLDVFQNEKKIGVLINALAISRISANCERVYTAIFGSQIDILQELQNKGGKISQERAVAFFDEVKANNKNFYADATFKTWFNYLDQNRLAELTNNEIVLSDFGKDFLAYIREWGLSKNKPY